MNCTTKNALTGSAAAIRTLQREIDVFLGVDANHKRRNVYDLLPDSAVQVRHQM